MTKVVDWDAPAAVMLWSEAEAVGFARGGTLSNGTLADAVQYFMGLTSDVREKAEVVVSTDGGRQNDWLNVADVEALALRADYPYRDN
jgi:hypothetical protein